MKTIKILGMAIALVCALPCLSEGNDDAGKWERNRKCPPKELPVNIFIDEMSNELIVNFHADLGSVMVEVTDANRMVVYQQQVETGDMPTVVIPLMDAEAGMLRITDGSNYVYGEFTIY